MPIIKTLTNAGSILNNTGGLLFISNVNTENVLLTDQIPGNILSTYKEIDFRVYGNILSSTLNLPTVQFKFKFGSQSFNITSNIAINASQSNAPFIIEGKVINTGATNSQVVFVKIYQSLSAGPFNLATSCYLVRNTMTVDTTQTQTMQVTATFGLSLLGTTTLTIDSSAVIK